MKLYREGGGIASGETSKEVRAVVTKDAGPLRGEGDAGVDNDGNDRCW